MKKKKILEGACGKTIKGGDLTRDRFLVVAFSQLESFFIFLKLLYFVKCFPLYIYLSPPFSRERYIYKERLKNMRQELKEVPCVFPLGIKSYVEGQTGTIPVLDRDISFLRSPNPRLHSTEKSLDPFLFPFFAKQPPSCCCCPWFMDQSDDELLQDVRMYERITEDFHVQFNHTFC